MSQKFLDLAKKESELSTDLRKSIGVVIVDTVTGNVVGHGSNQATLKFKWLINWHKKNCLRKIFKTPKNKFYWFCPGCALYRNHAEARAIRSLCEIQPENNLELFLYGHTYCCENCLKQISKYNITKLTFAQNDKI